MIESVAHQLRLRQVIGCLPNGYGGGVSAAELVDGRLLDELLEHSRDQAGGLRMTGEAPMPGEVVKAVLEWALETELTAYLGYEWRASAGYNSGW